MSGVCPSNAGATLLCHGASELSLSDDHAPRPASTSLIEDSAAIRLRLSPQNVPGYLPCFGTSFYLSKFANTKNFYPETAAEWGRDKYGIGSVLFGTALNRKSLPYGRYRLFVQRTPFAPDCFSFSVIGGEVGLPVVAAQLRGSFSDRVYKVSRFRRGISR